MGGRKFKHNKWLAQRKGSTAIKAFDLRLLNRPPGPQTLPYDLNLETLEYFELDGRNRRKYNKPSPIVFKINTEGEYLFSEVTDEGAEAFRKRNAKLLKDGSINPHRVAGEDDETAEDDDESGEQTTGDGSTSRDDSTTPSELAAAAEPMDVDPTTFVSSSATARGATSSSTPLQTSTSLPAATLAAPVFDPFGGGESGSDLSSLDDSESHDDMQSSPVKPVSPPPVFAKPRGAASVSSPLPRLSGAQPVPAVATGSGRSTSGRERSPSYSSGSEESEDNRRPTTKGSRVPSDAEDFKPQPDASTTTKVPLKFPPASKKATATDKPSKTSEKARPRPSSGAKVQDKARPGDRPEVGSSKRVNRTIKTTARPSLPLPPKEGPSPAAASSSSKLGKGREGSLAEGEGSGSTNPKIILKPAGVSAAQDTAASSHKESPSGKTKSKDPARPPSSSADSPKPTKSLKSAAAVLAAAGDAHRPSVKSKLSASISAAASVAEPTASSLAPETARLPSVPAKRSRASSPGPAADGAPAPKSDLDDVPAPTKKRSRPSISSKTSSADANDAHPPGAPSSALVDQVKASSKEAKMAALPTPAATSTASVPAVAADSGTPGPSKAATSGKATPSAKSSSSSAKPALTTSASPASASAAHAKRKPETLLKKVVTGGSSGPSTPTTGKMPKSSSTSTSTGSKDYVAQLLGATVDPTASTPSQPRTASTIRVQLSAKEQAELEQMRKEHEAEMADFLALSGMSRPLDMEHQGHVIRARQNAMRRDFDKHDDASNAYEKALQKFRHSGGGQTYEPSRPHPGNPPPQWTKHVPTFPHETGSLCGRLIACMDDRREESESGRLAFPLNKAEAANGDFVWVGEMEGKWDDTAAVAAYLADSTYFTPAQ